MASIHKILRMVYSAENIWVCAPAAQRAPVASAGCCGQSSDWGDRHRIGAYPAGDNQRDKLLSDPQG
jgi:hypothetical protein